jgi:hypothetical protein
MAARRMPGRLDEWPGLSGGRCGRCRGRGGRGWLSSRDGGRRHTDAREQHGLDGVTPSASSAAGASFWTRLTAFASGPAAMVTVDVLAASAFRPFMRNASPCTSAWSRSSAAALPL